MDYVCFAPIQVNGSHLVVGTVHQPEQGIVFAACTPRSLPLELKQKGGVCVCVWGGFSSTTCFYLF